MQAKAIRVAVYAVTLGCGRDRVTIDVPTTLGPDAAKRRAFWSFVSLRRYDPDKVIVESVELMKGGA